jgi:hypothetical protein
MFKCVEENSRCVAGLRGARDLSPGMPALILPSIQVNIRASVAPPPADDGNIYLKLPVNRF